MPDYSKKPAGLSTHSLIRKEKVFEPGVIRIRALHAIRLFTRQFLFSHPESFQFGTMLPIDA